MLGFLLELLFQFIVEVVTYVVMGISWRVGSRTFGKASMTKDRAHKAVAAIGLLLVGLAAGLFSFALLDHRVLPEVGLRGLSLVISPIAAGTFFEALGRRARARGVGHTALFTWWGGASCALGVALGRLIAFTVAGI